MNANAYLSVTYRQTCDLSQLTAYRTNQRRTLRSGAQNPSLGISQRLGANVYSCPIERSAILFRRERKDFHVRILLNWSARQDPQESSRPCEFHWNLLLCQ